MATLNEDTLYRTSTQYRLWSFSTSSLADLRNKTHITATDRVLKAIRRHRAHAAADVDAPIDVLTLTDSHRILLHYSAMLLKIAGSSSSQSFHFDPHVGATAVQFLRRFYLTNSPMTYHPKDVMFTMLWLAMKSENLPKRQLQLRGMVERLTDGLKIKGVTEEKVLAMEFIVCQGLRFTLEVRHPFRGVRAVGWELGMVARGEGKVLLGDEKDVGKEKGRLLRLELPAEERRWVGEDGELRPRRGDGAEGALERVEDACARVDGLLGMAGQLTNVYFLYTPSQILLSALWLADEPLARFYLSLKLPADSPTTSKILETIAECAVELSTYNEPEPGTDEATRHREELRDIDQKLFKCRNPDKLDLVSLNAAKKRQGGDADDAGRQAKKARTEERQRQMDSVFGGPLAKNGG